MPSRNKLRKTSSANNTSSECSKELRDLPEKDYHQLLASVAGLPKKILASESGGVSPGAGADVVTCGREQEKLTPAAQSCLEKLVGEIKNNNNSFMDYKIGKCTTFDDSVMTRRIEAFSAFTSTKKKPVRYEKEDMKFIDEDNDVEMMDLSSKSGLTLTFTRGNHEQTATEYMDDDIEAGLKTLDGTPPVNTFFDEWNEKNLLRNGRLLSRTQTILGPQSEGSFHPITEFVTGTDVIPSLTTAYEMPPLAKPLLPTPPTDDVTSTGLNATQTQLPNGVTNNIEDVITKSAVQEVVPNTRTELGKRKKGKKEKKENVIMAENVPGHMGQLSVEQLVHLIEGNHSEQNVKKQGQKDKSSSIVEVVSEETNQTKKERRRKSKELKENTQSTPPVVTIGAQQTKTGGPPAAATTTSSPPAASATPQPLKMEFTVANKRVTSPVSEKRRGKGAERNVRCSTEDCEEEFLSADEGVASPVGDEASTPPTVSTLTATTTTTTTASATSSASEVILDGRNYRADDEDVTQIERQCADEQEFITVNTKKKKVLEYTGKQQQRTGSAGKEERHQRVAERLEPARRSSLGMAPETRSTPLANSPLPSARRPTTASLADFLDDKVIDAAKMQTKSSVNISNAPKNMKKLHRNERNSQPDVEVSLPELPVERMSKSASQNATSDSPERTFSYADAAKKSSEPSRDNSPACVAVASPSGKSESPAPTTPAPVSRPVETSDTEVLPCANVSAGASGAADGLSFFYDETEAALEENLNEADNGATPEGAFVLNLGGKTVHFAKGMASSPVDAPPSNSHHMCMVEMLAQRWKMFQEGHVPQIYQPRIISS
ncbi:hypothetical protein V3C99_002544 [Haemonchus contortus]